jgi:N-acyl-D-amino-acid deacylase
MALAAAVLLLFSASCSTRYDYDVIIRGGVIYDGSGGAAFVGDLGVRGDSIVAVGPSLAGTSREEIHAGGLAVAPGFINMLSWANESLLEDGRSQSDIRQGITLEVFGEGWSMGPLTPSMKQEMKEEQGDIRYEVTWTTLAEYLEHLVAKGISPNVASFVGATTVRIHEVGYQDRPPTPQEMERMRQLVRAAMEDGALGVGSSLIYAPAFYASTDELVGLAEVAAEYDGMYISHIRSESRRLVPAVEEFLSICERAPVRGEIYHLKAAGERNWPAMRRVLEMIRAARDRGLSVTADMYTYTAGATGLDAAMPPWVQEGGHRAWMRRLQDAALRPRIAREMRTSTDAWENLYLAAGSPDRVLLVGFKTDSLKYLTGLTLGEVARRRGTTPEEAAMDLVVQDDSRVSAVYFLMSEENLRRQMIEPWVSFGSDAESVAPEGVFLKSNPHPRAYGNVARLLGRYVREQRLMTLEEAVRRLTSLPAENLRLERRGRLAPGWYADLVLFDPDSIADHATYDHPHQYATGVKHVLVNGTFVLKDGKHTGAMPGRVVRGPGWRTRGVRP